MKGLAQVLGNLVIGGFVVVGGVLVVLPATAAPDAPWQNARDQAVPEPMARAAATPGEAPDSAETSDTPEASTSSGGPDLLMCDEEYHYRWSLGGIGGVIGRLFLPGQGDGVLSYHRQDDVLRSELLVTSEKSDQGEYWQYGSDIDPRTGSSLEAWSAYRWRGKERSKRAPVETAGVMDLVAGILAVRRDPPDKPRPMDIWSDGKIYPVVVIPKKREEREIGDRSVMTRHYSIESVDIEGESRWKGSLELWLAEDAKATPVEIRIQRSLANLRLRLVETP